MALTVLVTANHWVLDIVAGLVLVAAMPPVADELASRIDAVTGFGSARRGRAA